MSTNKFRFSVLTANLGGLAFDFTANQSSQLLIPPKYSSLVGSGATEKKKISLIETGQTLQAGI